jgi:hypothetical protein
MKIPQGLMKIPSGFPQQIAEGVLIAQKFLLFSIG